MRYEPLIRNLAAGCISLVVSLVVAEYVVRWAFDEKPVLSQDMTTGTTAGFFRFDYLLGWANTPLQQGVFKKKEFKYRVSINSHGMRQPEVTIAPAANETRIAFLGDSFVWGVGVHNNERFPDLVEKNSCVKALNFGVGGYSPLQYYLQLDQVIAFAPKMLVIGFTYENEFEDNVKYHLYGAYKPYAVMEQGKLAIKGYPLPITNLSGVSRISDWEWLNQSVLYQKTVQLLRMHEKPPLQAGLEKFTSRMLFHRGALKPAQQELAQQAIEVNEEIFRLIRDKLQAHNIGLLVVGISDKCSFSDKCTLKRLPENSTGRRDIADIVQKTMQDLDIPFIDTNPYINPPDFLRSNPHWRPSGHQKTAALISHYLASQEMSCRE